MKLKFVVCSQTASPVGGGGGGDAVCEHTTSEQVYLKSVYSVLKCLHLVLHCRIFP